MQALYTLETGYGSANEKYSDEANAVEASRKGQAVLNHKIESSARLFVVLLAYLEKIAKYAKKDAQNRGAKYLPTEADKSVSTKVASNIVLEELVDNPSFAEKMKEAHLQQYVDLDWVKRIYQQMTASPEYLGYVSEEERTVSEDRSILKHLLFQLMLEDEAFTDFISDEWETWEDDKEMLSMLFDKWFKSPSSINFSKFISSEKKAYATSLLQTVIDKADYVTKLIEPKLKNWDPERVAIIDMVLLKMGICELLYFPTIPTKVTINEYIEIAKQYSTDQSGQFVNGVLDNILKDFTNEGTIQKIQHKK